MARSTRSKTASAKSKTAAPRSPRAKTGATAPMKTRVPAPEPKVMPAEKPTPGSEAMAAPTGLEMKKQELLQKVVTRSGIKKKDAKPVVEAMLEVLGETLAEGRELNLQPFGKVKLNRTKEMDRARVIVAKIRQSKKQADDKESVAAAVE